MMRLEFELLRMGPDRRGDKYTIEAMRKAVDEYQNTKEDAWITTKFSGKLADVEGAIEGLRMEGDAIMAAVMVTDTPAGKDIQEILKAQDAAAKDGLLTPDAKLELAMGGFVYERDPVTNDITSFRIASASFVPGREKIR